jgi:hypothetical protein
MVARRTEYADVPAAKAYMQKRGTSHGVGAAVCLVLAVAAYLGIASLAVFDPCRVFYRTHQPIQASPACQAYGAIGVTIPALVLGSLAFAVIAGARWLKARRASGNL